MSSNRGLRSLVIYFATAYAITWAGILAYVASKGLQLGEMGDADIPAVAGWMLLGPSAGGLVLTGLFEGRSGLARLVGRLQSWRAPARLWAAALGTNPLVFLALLGLLSLTVSPAFRPRFEPSFLMVGLLAGALEELGWTGFATPRLLVRMSPVRAGLVLGTLWATWHAAADFSINGASMGLAWFPYFGVYWIAILIPYRVLMTWVYARTGSLLIAMLMHGSYTGWQGALSPATSTAESFVWQAALAVAIGAVVVAIVAPRPDVHRGPAGRTLHRTRSALGARWTDA